MTGWLPYWIAQVRTNLGNSFLLPLRRRRQWHPTPVLLPGKYHGCRSLEGCSPWGRWGSDTTDFTFTFQFHALEKEMATHSSVLAWRIPGTGEPGGLTSMGSHRIGHNWSVLAAAAAASSHWEESVQFSEKNQRRVLKFLLTESSSLLRRRHMKWWLFFFYPTLFSLFPRFFPL